MKNIKLLVGIGLALLALCVSVVAQPALVSPLGYSGFTVGGSTPGFGFTYGTTTNLVVIPNTGRAGQTPDISFLSVTSDLASAQCVCWGVASPAQTIVSNSTTLIYVTSTNGYVAGSLYVIAHQGTNTANAGFYDAGNVSVISPWFTNSVVSPFFPYNTNSTYIYQLTLSAAPSYTTLPGDSIYVYPNKLGQIALASTTTTLTAPGGGIFLGQYQIPMLLSLSYTTAGKINVASGIYLP